MQTNTLSSQKTLRLSLYSGIALIVISMLFLGRDAQTSPALIKIGLAVATPALFYGIGALVYRHLNAPLAAPGIVATGAWLIAVELIHFYDQRNLLPTLARDYYWLGAALFAAIVITLTGHRARIWLLIPLVPLTQINAIAAIMSAIGLGVAWWPVLAFGLVMVWWESPLNDDEWKLVYRVSAVMFEVFLLIFSYWLPAQTANSMLITWATCAVLVAVLGVQHGVVNLGPLAIVLLSLAVIWGLPATWWPPIWLIIAIGTVLFIEQIARRDTDPDTTTLAIEMSTALAVLLSGFAALIAVLLPQFDITPVPVLTIFTLISSGGLLIWIGKRYQLVSAQHAGLWMLAAAWAKLYFLGRSDTDYYGLWLSVLAVAALLIERLLISLTRQKHKTLSSIQNAVVRWPLADMVVGLSVIIVIWAGFAALGLPETDPVLVTITLSITIGVWLAAGLLYRLPALLHVALWLAPLPYALLLILTLPPLRTLPMLGIAWQLLAAVYLLIGHALPRHRPAMLAPFFAAGYVLLGFGLTLTASNEYLLVVSLGWLIMITFVTSIAVISGAHPAWTALVVRLIPPEQRGYAFKQAHNMFVFLTAWLGVIWLYLMLGIAQFPTPHQGIILVLLSSAWIMVGRLLPRLPGMVGWPVYAAGWFMWLIGLLQVFFAPSEAIITAIFGLALSAEALYRSKAIHWMPVFILQILFSVLQVAWMFQISGFSFLLAVTLCISLAGMWMDRTHRDPAGRITAVTGAILSAAIWIVSLNPATTLGMIILIGAAITIYRRWELLIAGYVPVVIQAYLFGIASDWRVLIMAGGAQMLMGALIVRKARPHMFRTISHVLIDELDWATPVLWGGILSAAVGLVFGWQQAANAHQLTLYCAALAATTAVITVELHVPRLPYVSLGLLGSAMFLAITDIGRLPYRKVGDTLAVYNAGIAAIALLCQLPSLIAVRHPRPFRHTRWVVWWVKPLMYTSGFLTALSLSLLLVAQLYATNPIWIIVTGLLTSAIFGVVFLKTGRVGWVWLAVGMVWLVWAQFLTTAGLDGVQWHTIPAGIVMLVVARIFRDFPPQATEMLAVDALMVGSAIDIHQHGIVSVATILLALQLVGLAVYGYLDRRAVPFISAIVIVAGGAVYLVVRINPWLVPFAIGSLLLTGVVLLETRRSDLEQWVVSWRERLAI